MDYEPPHCSVSVDRTVSNVEHFCVISLPAFTQAMPRLLPLLKRPARQRTESSGLPTRTFGNIDASLEVA